MSFNRETGGRFFSPDNQAGRSLELPASTQFDWARTIIESKHAKLDGAHVQTAIGIQQEVAELLPPFQKRDDVPRTIYVTSFNRASRVFDGTFILHGTNEENRRDETLDIIELDIASGKLYQAVRGFTEFEFGLHGDNEVRTFGAKKTVTHSREELGTQGWLKFGEQAVDALQKVAEAIEKGIPYKNPKHRGYRRLPLVPDDPNPRVVSLEEMEASAREFFESTTGTPWKNDHQRPLT